MEHRRSIPLWWTGELSDSEWARAFEQGARVTAEQPSARVYTVRSKVFRRLARERARGVVATEPCELFKAAALPALRRTPAQSAAVDAATEYNDLVGDRFPPDAQHHEFVAYVAGAIARWFDHEPDYYAFTPKGVARPRLMHVREGLAAHTSAEYRAALGAEGVPRDTLVAVASLVRTAIRTGRRACKKAGAVDLCRYTGSSHDRPIVAVEVDALWTRTELMLPLPAPDEAPWSILEVGRSTSPDCVMATLVLHTTTWIIDRIVSEGVPVFVLVRGWAQAVLAQRLARHLARTIGSSLVTVVCMGRGCARGLRRTLSAERVIMRAMGYRHLAAPVLVLRAPSSPPRDRDVHCLPIASSKEEEQMAGDNIVRAVSAASAFIDKHRTRGTKRAPDGESSPPKRARL